MHSINIPRKRSKTQTLESPCLRNVSLKYDRVVYATKTELSCFLHLLDTNLTIQQFLEYDSSFQLADKYLVAMVFIYFKRAQLSVADYTYMNFFAGLCLAHSMEEDLNLSPEIYLWALGEEVKELLPMMLELKTLLWKAMEYRAAVSQYCCNQLMSFSKTHPIWLRERLPAPAKALFSNEVIKSFRAVGLKKNHTKIK